jgi:histidinol dehydrogenase
VAAVKKEVPPVLLRQCRFFLESSRDRMIARANALAGEHVQVMARGPRAWIDRIATGGAFFANAWSPAVMGDYWAGPSHVLPTGRSARFASGLSVMTFLKRSSLIEITPRAFRRGAPVASRMAEVEGLQQHARSLHLRTGDL